MPKMENKIKIGVLVEKNNKLLLIKELNSSDEKYYWNIIKGTFEHKKDKNFIETAKRECREEAGIFIKVNHLQGIMYLYRKNVTQFNFLASIQKGVPKIAKADDQKKENKDIIGIKLFTRNELKKIKESEFMNERAYLAVSEWLKGAKHNLDVFKFISKKE